MILARLWPVALVLVLTLGTPAVPATAAPAQDGGAVWTRDDPVLNPSKQPLVRDLGGGSTYTWSAPSTSGPLKVTNNWPNNWKWEGKVSWTEPPAQFVEGVSQTLKITSEVTTKGASGGIDFNAGWGWANGFGGSIPREQTAVCSGACGQSATTSVDITLPLGQAYDKDHPENNPTLWVTVDGQTVFYARYSRSSAASTPSQPVPAPTQQQPAPAVPVVPGLPPSPLGAPVVPPDTSPPGGIQPLDANLPPPPTTDGATDPNAPPPPPNVEKVLLQALSGDDWVNIASDIDARSNDDTPISDRMLQCAYAAQRATHSWDSPAMRAYTDDCTVRLFAGLLDPDGNALFPHIRGAASVMHKMAQNGVADPDAQVALSRLFVILLQQDRADWL